MKLGDDRTRMFYAALISTALVALVAVAVATSWWSLVGLVGFLPLSRAVHTVTDGAKGRDLVPVLQLTGAGELLFAAGIFTGLLLAR